MKDVCSQEEWLGGIKLMSPCMRAGCPHSTSNKTVQPFLGCVSEAGAEGRVSIWQIIFALKNFHKIKPRNLRST